MKTHLIFKGAVCFITLIYCSCTQSNANKEESRTLTFDTSGVKTPFKAIPDNSTDLASWEKHYEMYPERWDLAFNYLTSMDVNNLPLGRQNLSDDVYVSVSEYQTKDSADTRFESHLEYIDVQYLVSGSEYIQILRDTTIPKVTEYDPKGDITFYKSDRGDMLKADSTRYFVFFPQDAHRPCLKIDTETPVRKVVVKIKMN